MGFLDKLLGRGKEAADTAGDAVKDVGEKAKEEFDEAKDRITGDETPEAREAPPAPPASEVTQSEQRLDEARDQAARDEGRMP
jgi:hypothetical protein